MITNAYKKILAQLDQSKYRRRLMLFKAEGTKCVLDTLGHFMLYFIVATPQWLEAHGDNLPADARVFDERESVIGTLSNLSSRPEVIAVYHIPDHQLDIEALKYQLVLALDTIQDPGNMGTIVRLADWFGVKDIICSKTTVDIYNPKTVMATMGAISRVKVHYVDLPATINQLTPTMKVYGTFLEGNNIFKTHLTPTGIIVLGNEGNGISSEVGALVTDKITIPPYPIDEPTSESLNVAMATAITLAQFRSNG